tara:strand:+ start:6729 stop:7097 length:369 start_codon:yes stop_codon:yes gene_type:complete
VGWTGSVLDGRQRPSRLVLSNGSSQQNPLLLSAREHAKTVLDAMAKAHSFESFLGRHATAGWPLSRLSQSHHLQRSDGEGPVDTSPLRHQSDLLAAGLNQDSSDQHMASAGGEHALHDLQQG